MQRTVLQQVSLLENAGDLMEERPPEPADGDIVGLCHDRRIRRRCGIALEREHMTAGAEQRAEVGNPDSPAVKKLEARKVELENFEKKLDVEIQKIQTQLQAANTEIQSADQMLQQNIQRSFSYKAG